MARLDEQESEEEDTADQDMSLVGSLISLEGMLGLSSQLAPEVAPGGAIARGPGVRLLRLPGWREVGILVGGGEAGGAEAEHEHAAGQQVLGHVQGEAGAVNVAMTLLRASARAP